MKEIFESNIGDISELEVKCYSDPVNMEHTMEIWAKTGDEEYIYKFIGPGVRMANIPMFDDCINLSKELALQKETADTWSKEYHRLSIENEKLKKKIEKLEQEKSNFTKIPMVDDCLKLSKEIEKLTFEKEMMRKGNDKLRREKNKDINELKQKIQELTKSNKRLSYKISELEELKTPTIENFEEPSSRADILDLAKKCVCGQREQDYGTPESNFQLIADLWNGYLGFMDHPRDQIRATDVAMLMALMKIARIRNGGGSGDSFVDLAGYAACGGEIWHGERHKDK